MPRATPEPTAHFRQAARRRRRRGLAYGVALLGAVTTLAACAHTPAPAPVGGPSTRSAPGTVNPPTPQARPTWSSSPPAPGPDAGDPGDVSGMLAAVTIVDELPSIPGYDRSCGPGRGCVFGTAWKDVDRTGCDTRNRVLAAQLRDPVFKPGTRDCKVTAGTLDDPYGGTEIAFGVPGAPEIEIDHVFALARAWDAGASSWTLDARTRFANDLDNLLAVSGSLNASKSDAGPGTWLPPNLAYACTFGRKYLHVAAKYHLAITTDDATAVTNSCALASG